MQINTIMIQFHFLLVIFDIILSLKRMSCCSSDVQESGECGVFPHESLPRAHISSFLTCARLEQCLRTVMDVSSNFSLKITAHIYLKITPEGLQ